MLSSILRASCSVSTDPSGANAIFAAGSTNPRTHFLRPPCSRFHYSDLDESKTFPGPGRRHRSAPTRYKPPCLHRAPPRTTQPYNTLGWGHIPSCDPRMAISRPSSAGFHHHLPSVAGTSTSALHPLPSAAPISRSAGKVSLTAPPLKLVSPARVFGIFTQATPHRPAAPKTRAARLDALARCLISRNIRHHPVQTLADLFRRPRRPPLTRKSSKPSHSRPPNTARAHWP